MEVIIFWIVFSLVVGAIGSGRKIGFFGAFFLSLLLSPLIGLIVALVSKDKGDEAYKAKILEAQKSQQETLTNLSQPKQDDISSRSIADELGKLKKLRDDNSISDEEYQKLKDRLINT